ncbi:tRNA(Ile)-lysidine synthase [Usitatibacter rugosus]|uniref:tRNA(Ile)-lysidine synthase n=1 Tax=Usitatibacter rugosus TaxID=2732067 RepID=A0A6M4GXL3_9PROT|nr:tRNA lysidine(34) synthetase TilS [Usitatibacter rugosus]QJR11752.1 tRNA(Ile)-lysidine synthase [Usitatibacter rugosus]
MASSRNSPSEALLRSLRAHVAPGTPVCAGLSGGLDSVVLLHLLATQREAHGFELSALHVHHGLSPNADRWASACEQLCETLRVPLSIERVHVERDSGTGLEAAAREARYGAYARASASVIALAHHLDDQAETVLLQLLRGTGLRGAAGMPEWRALPGTTASLWRPLLSVTRSELESYAKTQGLTWIEDESNASTAFDRNFLRLQVAPLLEGRFPGWKQAISRFSRHAGTSAALLEQAAREEGVDPGSPLAVELLRAQSPEARAHALRTYLEDQGLPMPTEARLAEMTRQLTEAREDARVRIEHGGAALVRHRDTVHVDRGPRGASPWNVPWAGEEEVALGADRGAVRFATATGAGIAERYTHDGTWHFGPRAGGERIRLEAERPTRTLKNLLQETGVPDWERGRLPLLFHGGALVWVPRVGVAAGYRCGAGEPGRVPEWFPGARA